MTSLIYSTYGTKLVGGNLPMMVPSLDIRAFEVRTRHFREFR